MAATNQNETSPAPGAEEDSALTAVVCGQDADADWLAGFLQNTTVCANQQELAALLEQHKDNAHGIVVVPATTGRNLAFLTQTADTLRTARDRGGVRCVMAQPLGDATQVVSALKSTLRRVAALDRAGTSLTGSAHGDVKPDEAKQSGAPQPVPGRGDGRPEDSAGYVVVVSASIDPVGDAELVRQSRLLGEDEFDFDIEVAFDGGKPGLDDVATRRGQQPLAVVRADLRAPGSRQIPLWNPSSVTAVVGVRLGSALSRLNTHGTDGIEHRGPARSAPVPGGPRPLRGSRVDGRPQSPARD